MSRNKKNAMTDDALRTIKRAGFSLGFATLMLHLGSIFILPQSQTARPDRGMFGKGTQQVSEIDSINLQNGGVSVDIPLASLPPMAGGKLGYTLTAHYNNKLYIATKSQALGSTAEMGGCPELYSPTVIENGERPGGWQIGSNVPGGYYIDFRMEYLTHPYGRPECYTGDGTPGYTYFKPVLVTPDGSEHDLRIDGSYPTGGGSLNGYYQFQSGTDPITTPTRFYTTDGTYLTAIVNPTSYSTKWTIYAKDGTRIEQTATVQNHIDPNGNTIEFGTNSSPSYKYAKDAHTGRMIKWSDSTYQSQTATKVEYQSVGGSWQTVWVVWGTTQVQGKTYYTEAWNLNTHQPCWARNTFGTTIPVVRKIVFPGTESGIDPPEYEFAYNSDTTTTATTTGFVGNCGDTPSSYQRTVSIGGGQVSEVTTPTGAVIEYAYSTDGVHDFSGGSSGGEEDMLKDRITSKTVNHDGLSDTWTYSGDPTDSTVTNPDGSTHKETYHPINIYYTQNGGSDGLGGLQIKSIDQNRVMTEKHWTLLGGALTTFGSNANYVSYNSVVDTEYTTLLDTDGTTRLKMTAKTFEYDYNGDLTKVTEYDWINLSNVTYTNSNNPVTGIPTGIPSGTAILRVTDNSYYNIAANASASTAYHKRTVGSSTVVLGKLKESTVGTSSTAKGHSRFSYDGQSYGTAPTLGNLTKASAYNDVNSTWIDTLTTYTTRGNVATVTDGNTNVTQMTYGSIGGYSDLYPTQTVAAYGTSIARTSTTAYDLSTGLVTSVTDEDNDITNATEYDILGRPTKVISADNTALESWTTTEYSDSNRRVIVRSDLEELDDGKKVAIQHFDQLGRVRLSRTLENAATEDPTDEADGIKVETKYKTESGYTYTATSNPYRTTSDPTFGWTRSKSWATGRKQEVETFSGSSLPAPWGSNSTSTGVVKTEIDLERTLVTDQAGKQRISKTNTLGHLTDVWEVKASDSDTESISFPNYSGLHGYKTSYTYDTLNNLLTVVQGSQTRTFTYSSLSRLTSAANPESGTISYGYDPNGNLTSKTDARSITTSYTYDGLNRVTARDYDDSTPDVDYTYGTTAPKVGKLTKVESSVSTTEYTSFDILGRVTGHKQTTDGGESGGYTTGYTYNLGGALIEQTYPSGRVVKNVLESNGELEMVQSKKNASSGYWNYAKNFTYNAAGAVTSMQLGNGSWESTQFNSRLQPTQIALGTTNTGTLAYDKLKLNYGYGTTANNGNVLTQDVTVKRSGQSDLVFNQTYTYDELNRLKIAEEKTGTTTNWKQTFTFDRYGNRRFDQSNTTQPASFSNPDLTNPTFNASNNRMASGQNWTYDAAGNITVDPDGRQFTYDAENKQIEVKDSSSATLGTYYFDGDGKRVKKVVPNGETTIFVYDAGGKLIGEYSTIVESTQDAKVQYLTNDNLGTPRINTDANGAITSRSDYMPYGEEIVGLGGRSSADKYVADDVRQGFTGYENDGETGLDYAEARMYVNKLARFSSSDPLLSSGRPILPQSWNRYSYVRNNPLSLIDPTGLYECTAGKEKCEKFEAGVKEAVKALKMYDPKSKEYKAIARALNAFWDIKKDQSKMGIKDGLKVVQGDDSKIRGMANVSSTLLSVTKGRTTTLTLKSLTLNVKSDAWDNKERLPGMIANEGSNVQDARDADKNDRENSKWDKEYSSLEADTFVMEKLHPDKPYDFAAGRVYDPSWKATDRDANRDKGIRQILTADKKDGGYGLKPPKGKRQ